MRFWTLQAAALALAFLGCSNTEERGPGGFIALDPESKENVGAYLVHLTPGFDGVETEMSPGSTYPDVPAARVPVASTVVFKNLDTDHFLHLTVEGDFGASTRCRTVSDFEIGVTRATSPALAPHGIASICFHRAGRFRFRATGGEAPLVGFVDVLAVASEEEEGS